jgi:hypothetical protein
MRLAFILLLSSFCIAQEGVPKSLSVNSTPAAGSQATASTGAIDNQKHVADQVCFSAGSTTAPSLTQLSVNIRDGASGAGTVLASFIVVIAASSGQNQVPFCAPIGVSGSNNTAMTAEWSASLANLFEQVTLYYHNRPN